MISLLEPGDPTAPVGSKPWCLALYYEGCALKKEDTFIVKRLKFTLITLRSERYFEKLTDKNGHPFLMWEDFVQNPEPFGLGMRVEVAAAIMEEQDENKLTGKAIADAEWKASQQEKIAERAGPEGVPAYLPRGTNQHGLDQGCAVSTSLPRRGSASAVHLIARIKRDHPDIAARLAAGEFPSAQAAARAAGIARQSADGLGRPGTLARRIMARGDDYADAVVAAILTAKEER